MPWSRLTVSVMARVFVRETSVILAALIGTFVLREASGMRRMPAVAAVAAGNILLNF